MALPRVILIGGPPMAGKSTVARLLGARHGHAAIATDDLGVAVRAAAKTGPQIAEDHREYFVCRTVEQLWQESLASLRELAPAIEAVARLHANPWAAPAIIEGWAIPLSSTPGCAPDRGFWTGASDEQLMIEHFVERSLRLAAHVRGAEMAGWSGIVSVGASDTPSDIADRVEGLLDRPTRA